MEFMYRAGDERRSRSPPPPAAPSTPGSGSPEGHGGAGPAERVGNSVLWQPDLPPPETATAVDADELRRQEEKARIREWILREEAEHLELELEVRRELREQMLQMSWPALGRPARGSGTAAAPPAPATNTATNSSPPVFAHEPDLAPPEKAAVVDADGLRRQAEKARIRGRILREEAEHWELELEVRKELREQMLQLSWPALGQPARGSGTAVEPSLGTITAANSSLPVVAHEARPKASALATVLTKRKSPDRPAGAPTSCKKQKSTSTCTVCGITANSEKAMQDHLNGKVHRNKTVALSELVPDVTEQEAGEEEEELMAMETLGDYKPMKFMMETDAGALSEVTQMDGFVLCELCNVRTADQITMMCHLQGSKHISNAEKKHRRQPSVKPSGAATTKKLVDLEDNGVPLPHNVRRLKGFLHCELCDVKIRSMNVMHQHLSGKKHKSKANTGSDATVNVSSGGKKVAKAQQTNTAVISNMAAKVKAPLENKSLQPKLGDDSELQDMVVAPQKEDLPTGDNNKTPGTEMMKNIETSVGAQLNTVCDSDSLTMEVDGVMHPLWQVDGILICISCNTKAESDTVMKSHLKGKKHKLKMALAAARGNKDLSILAISKPTKGNVEAELAAAQAKIVANEEAEPTPSLAVSQMKNTAAMASMAVDRPVEAQLATCTTEKAEEEHAAVDSNDSVIQAKESVITNDTIIAPVQPIKIQVEGRVFTVTQQENGRLSCELCGVHGCDKDSMIQHLYTRTHWGNANLADKKEKEQACMAAAATVDGS